MSKNQAQCPECDAEIILGKNTEKGEVISCKDCSVELEVVSLQPLKINHLPKMDEDWGE
jgi:alpha-aminoadipate carrier protein LysW